MENPLRALHGSHFLRAWHARHAGAASSAFGYGRTGDNARSSYDLLVDDAVALGHVATVVDVACGDGYLLELLARRFPFAQIIGVDMTSEEIAIARNRGLPGSVRLATARAEALPLPDASTDAVVCHMALMLFDDARSVVNEVARVIRPGGIFAAVLGPAPGNSELVARFRTLLREAEAAEQLPPLQIGDPLTFVEDTLLPIFASDVWNNVRLEQFALRFEGTDDQIQATLLAMYDVARLSDAGRATLSQRLNDEMLSRRQTGQTTECVLRLRHLVAERGR
jgi:SAM-dependent methyltransferase